MSAGAASCSYEAIRAPSEDVTLKGKQAETLFTGGCSGRARWVSKSVVSRRSGARRLGLTRWSGSRIARAPATASSARALADGLHAVSPRGHAMRNLVAAQVYIGSPCPTPSI